MSGNSAIYGWDRTKSPPQRVPVVASPEGHLNSGNLNGLAPVSGGGGPITVSTTAISAPALDDDTTHVMWQMQDNPSRFRIDGTDPTASIGTELEAGDFAIWPRAIWAAARFIRAGGADGTLFYQELK